MTVVKKRNDLTDNSRESLEDEKIQLIQKLDELMKDYEKLTGKLPKKYWHCCEEHYDSLESIKDDLLHFKNYYGK